MDALEDILVALPAPELKHLAKSLRLNASQQMSDLTQAILKHSRQTNISSFFMSKNKDGGTAAIIMNRQLYKFYKNVDKMYLDIFKTC